MDFNRNVDPKEVEVIQKSFKHLNKPLAKKATNRIAKDFTKMTKASEFLKLTKYLNALPKLEREYIILHLLTGVMMLYNSELSKQIEKESTEGLYI